MQKEEKEDIDLDEFYESSEGNHKIMQLINTKKSKKNGLLNNSREFCDIRDNLTKFVENENTYEEEVEELAIISKYMPLINNSNFQELFHYEFIDFFTQIYENYPSSDCRLSLISKIMPDIVYFSNNSSFFIQDSFYQTLERYLHSFDNIKESAETILLYLIPKKEWHERFDSELTFRLYNLISNIDIKVACYGFFNPQILSQEQLLSILDEGKQLLFQIKEQYQQSDQSVIYPLQDLQFFFQGFSYYLLNISDNYLAKASQIFNEENDETSNDFFEAIDYFSKQKYTSKQCFKIFYILLRKGIRSDIIRSNIKPLINDAMSNGECDDVFNSALIFYRILLKEYFIDVDPEFYSNITEMAKNASFQVKKECLYVLKQCFDIRDDFITELNNDELFFILENVFSNDEKVISLCCSILISLHYITHKTAKNWLPNFIKNEFDDYDELVEILEGKINDEETSEDCRVNCEELLDIIESI